MAIEVPRLLRNGALIFGYGVLVLLAGCAAGTTTSKTGYEATDPNHVQILTASPSRPYEELGRVGDVGTDYVAGHQMNRLKSFNSDGADAGTAIPSTSYSMANIIAGLRSQAAALGADAVILQNQELQISPGTLLGPTNGSASGIAIRFKDSTPKLP
jgi:hypothetical protein